MCVGWGGGGGGVSVKWRSYLCAGYKAEYSTEMTTLNSRPPDQTASIAQGITEDHSAGHQSSPFSYK